MKPSVRLVLFALLGFLAASQSALAASKKADERTSALVAALHAVSPDPLGGRLGLAASAARAETAAVSSTRNVLTAQSARAIYDERAYVIWKSSQKS